jgi:hypothetical protein
MNKTDSRMSNTMNSKGANGTASQQRQSAEKNRSQLRENGKTIVQLNNHHQ